MAALLRRLNGRRLPRAFRLLWVATAVSNLGDGVRTTALPLAAVSVTNDPRLIAGVAVADRLPWLLLIVPGGVLADRVDRRRLRVGLDAARALVVAAFAVAAATGALTIWVVYAVSAALASAEAVVDSSSMALVPSMVPNEDLERAGSALASAELVANSLIGPPVGGLLFAAAVAAPFFVDATSFAVAALVALSIGGSFRATRTVSETPARTAFTADAKEGFRWLWHEPLVRNLALVSTGLGFFVFVANGVFVVFARVALGLGDLGYGLFLILPALGGLAGSLVAPRLRKYPLSVVLFVATGLTGTLFIVVSQQRQPVIAAVLLAAGVGGTSVWNILTLALRQRTIPDELLGRVGASYRLLVYFAMPLGAATGGVLANTFGVRASVLTAGFGLAAMAPVAYFTTAHRQTTSQDVSR